MTSIYKGMVLWGLSLFLLLVELLDGLNLLFELHSSVLKPDLDLSLGQAKLVCHFDPSSPREVVIRMELLFQLQSLVTGVSLTASSPEAISPREQMCTTCNTQRKKTWHYWLCSKLKELAQWLKNPDQWAPILGLWGTCFFQTLSWGPPKVGKLQQKNLNLFFFCKVRYLSNIFLKVWICCSGAVCLRLGTPDYENSTDASSANFVLVSAREPFSQLRIELRRFVVVIANFKAALPDLMRT